MLIAKVSLLVVLGFVANCHAEAQFDYGYPGQHYFRSGLPASSLDDGTKKESVENRFFFTTLTVTMATTTYTSTFTTSTTCTTSTAALKICSPSKGRRRRSHRDISSLMYNEAAETEELDPNVFLIPVESELVESKNVENAVRKERDTAPVPFVLQPGFRTSENIGSGRFLLAFGTTTLTTTKTSTYTAILTALCASTTGFISCAGGGK